MAKADSTTDSSHKDFFPVADYLQSEISYVDSTPLAILRYNIQDKHKDSGFIQQDEFNRLAAAFLQTDLDHDSMEKKFTETSFFDKTSGYIGFTYTASSTMLPLQRVDVLALPVNGVSKVKSVYMEKIFKAGDTAVTQKMYWQTRHNFMIITSRTLPGKPPVVGQTKVVWDTDTEE